MLGKDGVDMYNIKINYLDGSKLECEKIIKITFRIHLSGFKYSERLLEGSDIENFTIDMLGERAHDVILRGESSIYNMNPVYIKDMEIRKL